MTDRASLPDDISVHNKMEGRNSKSQKVKAAAAAASAGHNGPAPKTKEKVSQVMESCG